jgi:hypothetical protein
VLWSCTAEDSLTGTGPTSSHVVVEGYVSSDDGFDFDVRVVTNRDFTVRGVTR